MPDEPCYGTYLLDPINMEDKIIIAGLEFTVIYAQHSLPEWLKHKGKISTTDPRPFVELIYFSKKN